MLIYCPHTLDQTGESCAAKSRSGATICHTCGKPILYTIFPRRDLKPWTEISDLNERTTSNSRMMLIYNARKRLKIGEETQEIMRSLDNEHVKFLKNPQQFEVDDVNPKFNFIELRW